MGAVFQDFRLLQNKTVYQNVAFTLQVLGRKSSQIERSVPEVLDLVGLADKMQRFPDQLSGGEQQRVAIARAFVNRPPSCWQTSPPGTSIPSTSVGS
jgi:cell division transport system ATP-binding protein